MKPLSKRKRNVYLILCFAIFVLTIPVVILYANGYRLGDKLTLFKTGGIYLSIPASDADIYINNKQKARTNIFDKDFFAQNLKPGTYSVKIAKEGYAIWKKNMKVGAGKVTIAYPFLIPEKMGLIGLEQYLPHATSTPVSQWRQNPQYKEAQALFAKTDEIADRTAEVSTASSTITGKALPKDTVFRDNIAVWRDAATIYAEWRGNLSSIPAYFCNAEKCENGYTVISSENTVMKVNFFPGRRDVIIFSTKDGIFVTELDVRGGQNIYKIVDDDNSEFAVGNDESIYVKSGKNIYEVEFE
jgi:hypothetical protein